MDTEQDYRDIGTADGTLVSYALHYIHALKKYDLDHAGFSTARPNRLNKLETQGEDFTRQFYPEEVYKYLISFRGDWRVRGDLDYLYAKYEILKAIVEQAYPNLSTYVSEGNTVIPHWTKSKGTVQISKSNANLTVFDGSNHQELTYQISEQYLQNNNYWKKIVIGALCVAGGLAAGIIASTLSEDDNE